MINSLSEYVAALLAGQPDIAEAEFLLRPPKPPADLDEQFAKLALPQDHVRAIFGEFDGQRNDGLKLFCEFSLLSSDSCIEIYGDLVGDAVIERGGPGDPRIRKDKVWREQWFPFAWNQNTNKHLCLDLDPTSLGVAGQIIYVGDWGELSVHGESLTDFLNQVFRKLQSTGFEKYDGVWNEFKGLLIPGH